MNIKNQNMLIILKRLERTVTNLKIIEENFNKYSVLERNNH